VLFERCSRGWGIGLSLVLFGLVFASLGLWAYWDTGKGELLLPIVAAMLAASGLGAYLMARRWWMKLVVHEFGVSPPTWGEDRWLHYGEIGTLTWKEHPFTVRFAPAPGVDRPTIHYNLVDSQLEDADLLALRDQVAQVIADRWDEELDSGPV